MKPSRHRPYATIVALGAGVLLARTIWMIAGGSLGVLVPWVGALLLIECLLDLTAVGGAVTWWATRGERQAALALRAVAAAIVLHAVRVLVFVTGRVGPWVDVDVRPEHRTEHPDRWTWGGVYFAAILAMAGVIGVVVVWQIRRRGRHSTPSSE